MLKNDATNKFPSFLFAVFLKTPCICMICIYLCIILLQVNIEKLFWNKKEEKYEETSGNILLTYRSITQKPLGKLVNW